jgi:hypothetical protein
MSSLKSWSGITSLRFNKANVWLRAAQQTPRTCCSTMNSQWKRLQDQVMIDLYAQDNDMRKRLYYDQPTIIGL